MRDQNQRRSEHTRHVQTADDGRLWPLSEAAAGAIAAYVSAVRSGSDTGDGVNLPGYEVVSCLGSGASSTVYAAFRRGTDYLVAIKVLKREGDGGASANLANRELDQLLRLRVSCVPRLLDYGKVDGRPYLVTEYVEGKSLDRYCRDQRLNLRQTMTLVSDVLHAVHELHEHGVIHRDLKPSNILIDRTDRPVIVDLGTAMLARAGNEVHRDWRSTNCPVGSLAFMAPEQAQRKDDISIRCDLFSVATSAFYVLSGRSVHDVSLPGDELIRSIAERSPRSVRSMDESLPHSVAAILDKALAFRPQDRFCSAREFADQIQRWLDGYPVELAEPSRLLRAGLFVRRNPVATFFAICAAIGIIVTAFAVAHASAQQAIADEQANLAHQRELLLEEHRSVTLRMKQHSKQLGIIVERFLQDARDAGDGGRFGRSLAIIRGLDDLLHPDDAVEGEHALEHAELRDAVLRDVLYEMYRLNASDDPALDQRIDELLTELAARRAESSVQLND